MRAAPKRGTMTDDRPTLATLLRGRSRAAVARFVAALYDARGSKTRPEGGTVVVDGGRYLVVPAGPVARFHDRLFGPAPDAVDAVVAVDAGRADALASRYDAPVLTPADLDALARYGLDRPAAEAVVGDALGVGLDELRPASQPTPTGTAEPDRPHDPNSGRPDAGDTPTDRDRRAPAAVPRSAPLVAVAAVALVALFVLAPVSLGPETGLLSDATGSQASTPDPSADAPGTTDAPTSPRSESPASGAPGLAPGLTTEGVADADALAEAHATTLSNRSYRWRLTYVESVNGTERGQRVESVVVESPTVYTSSVRTEGNLTSRGPISRGSSYADGDQRHRRTSNGVVSEPIGDLETFGRQEWRAHQYYGVLLDGQRTSEVRTLFDVPRLYAVDIRGVPAPNVRNYSATARVTPEGFVPYYSGSYCFVSTDRRTPDVCISLTMRYLAVGQTTVDPPAWYRNASTPLPPENTTQPSGTAVPNATTDAPGSPAPSSSPSAAG